MFEEINWLLAQGQQPDNFDDYLAAETGGQGLT